MKLIILEGCDFSGKSFKKQEIITNENIKKHHTIKLPIPDGSETLQVMNEKELKIWKNIFSENKHIPKKEYNLMFYTHMHAKFFLEKNEEKYDDYVIFQDRNFFSTLVYQYEYIMNTSSSVLQLHSLIPNVQTEIIIGLPTWETILNRQEERVGQKDEDEVSFYEKKMKIYYDRYKMLLKEKSHPLCFYNFYDNITVLPY